MTAIHVTNGDSAAGTLRHVVAGPVITTCDVLHEGPAPMTASMAEWYDVRARVLADGARDRASIGREYQASDRAMVDAAPRGVVELWFEHDLFDQLLLIRALDLLAEAGARDVRLVCIGAFPGVERFIGLGQLTRDQMQTLVGAGRPVTADVFDLARRAWRAFRQPDPAALEAVAIDHPELEFLGSALRRFLEEYPSAANGLSRTENAALAALGDGPLPAHELFRATQRQEARPFMGDSLFYRIVERLAAAPVPLVDLAPGDAADGRRLVRLTARGSEVSEARADAIALNGLDVWRGGVHLAGRAAWRWDEAAGRLVS